MARRRGWCLTWGAGAPRHLFTGFRKEVLRWERLAAAGRFVRCSLCGRREFRKWDRSLPPGGLSCCRNEECNALCESESDVARPRIFPSLCDWLDPEVPVEWLADFLEVIRQSPHLDWMLLTKRPELFFQRVNAVLQFMYHGPMRFCGEPMWVLDAWLNMMKGHDGLKYYPHNVFLGVTIESEEVSWSRAEALVRIPAAKRFISVEPMLSAVDLVRARALNVHCGKCGGVEVQGAKCGHCGAPVVRPVDLVIVGGESGPGARPVHPDWVEDVRYQCAASGTAFNFKQWGEWAPFHPVGVTYALTPDCCEVKHGSSRGMMYRLGKEKAGRRLDGRTHDGVI